MVFKHQPACPCDPAWRLRFLLSVILVILSFTLVPNTQAQTEVEGEVSGVWDIDGSPYILVDNATVSEEESLSIEPGVEVVFGEDLSLVVNGQISAVGTEEDTILFHGSEDVVTGSLRLASGEDTIRFQYCRFDSLSEAIQSDNHAVELSSCRFVNNWKHLDLTGIYVFVTNCFFIGGDAGGDGIGSIIFGTPRRRSGTFIVTENEIQGRTAVIDFNWADNTEFIGNTFNSNLNGRSSWLTFSNELNVVCTDNTGEFRMMITNTFRRLGEALFEDNEALSITVHDQPDWGVVIRNNRFMLGSALGSINRVTNAEFYNNVMEDRLNIYCEVESEVIMDHNLIYGIEVRGFCDVNLSNNTILGGITEYIDNAENISLNAINNIFAGFDLSEFLIDPAIGEVSGGYNCFWGAERPYGADRELLEGDIVADPSFVGGHPFEYQIQANSPCIDAGDPDSPEDPDGTRADIGALFYDQENGMPPAIISRHDAYTGWGMDFRYAARVTDWDGALDFEFDGLPEWLQIDEDRLRRDFISDSAVVSGQVPNEQDDFVFTVTARDEDGLEDTLSVQVFVYPMTVLTGQIGGTLTREGSPYVVADTAWVVEDDSLVIEPGCRLLMDNRPYEERAQSVLFSNGRFIANGTENDSIIFASLQDSIAVGYFILWESTFGEFDYCNFQSASMYSLGDGISITNSVIGSASNASIYNSLGSIRFSNNVYRGKYGTTLRGSGVISQNTFEQYEYESAMIGLRGDSVTFSQNIVRGYGAAVYVSELRKGIFTNNKISNGRGDTPRGIAIFRNYQDYEYSDIEITNNTIDSVSIAISASGTVPNLSDMRLTVRNNLLTRVRNIGIAASADTALISNNVVYQTRRAILQNYTPSRLDITNNLFLSDSILLRLYDADFNGVAFNYNCINNVDTICDDMEFIGHINMTNANGDSCDAGFNLFLDPQIVGLDSLDFRLFQGSPLIDAGNPDSVFNDVDDSANDIGLFGGPYGESYDYPTGVGESDVAPPEGFKLSKPYPNPFNSQVQLIFTLPKPGSVEIKIFDVTGRLMFGKQLDGLSVGSHRYVWTGTDNTNHGLPTGIYYFELAFEGAKLVRPLVMLK